MSIFGTAFLMLAMQALPLQGIVFKKGTTEPLSKATVELRRDQQAAIIARITTEDDGRFQFENVAPGRYRMTVTRRGYVRPPLSIVVAPNQTRSVIQLPMTPSGTISGRIYGTNSQPIGNVEVLALKATYPEGRRTLVPVQSATSNDLGEYRLFWLPPGRYYVSATHPKAQAMFRRASGIFGFTIGGDGASVSMISAVGKSDPALGGLELEPDTENERYAAVFLGGTTDEQSATSVDIRAGTEVTGANIIVTAIRPRHVRGLVVDGLTGRPAQYASLAMARDPDDLGRQEPEVNRETATFDVVLLPGVHTLNATAASGEGSVTFRLGDADVENLTIPTLPTFDIAGHIALEGEPNSGAALGALQITMRHDPPRNESRLFSSSYSNPLPNGSFVVSGSIGDYRLNIAPLLNVTPSRVQITAIPAALQNAYVKSIRLGNMDVLNGTLHLENKPSVPLEVVIGKSSGTMEGQVTASSQSSPSDVSVVLIPNVRRRTELYRTTTTDVAGRFHFDRIPPGDYKVFAWEEVQDGAWFDPDFMKGVENRGTPARITDGQTASVRIELIP